ncbi:phosphocholine-specific phospholipase C [Salmonirosea aquatica]|uniref:phospholipase C n=1 Tax=Salmonirosea aquatica TaxID=2654236 RepID=A0A7C9BGD4_9BACT|nr:phospholipase C, phosphocholine-specific [Cytophagaceae bacterium SJW1-29]
MNSRRDFLKKAALLSTGFAGILPDSIQKAYAIAPAPGSTYLDAEHVVILMQENRSFDHTFGTLRGVRGFNDPRAVALPNQNKVWLQTNAANETYAPFRLNIKDTKSTWMSSLPHSWENQVDARNGGKMDGWLEAKKSGRKEYAAMPLTLGYYTREDLPFYYALADAFTVCDQNFCSSLTGTTPNRLFLWTGTVRDPANPEAIANVRNENVDYDDEADWTTFPERLEKAGISWRIYQNEISLSTGLGNEEEGWLSNFTDNPIEWFSQYRVRFHPAYYAHITQEAKVLPERITALEKKLNSLAQNDPAYAPAQKKLAQEKAWLKMVEEDLVRYAPEKFEALPEPARNLHRKAFTTNTGDPDYRKLTPMTYRDGTQERQVNIPQGDVLHQFRSDVENQALPTVSWLVAPENFSDHPGAPWYGAWYISEVMDILTKNPEVWKKTIFILAYDENDGYFDHVPPFVPAHPDQPETGLNSPDLDTRGEFVTAAQESQRKNGGRTGPVGLGFRVPLVVASPWSRGGYVCSEVFDHTSVLQFLEHFLSHKKQVPLEEKNISSWRRTVCGDLTSVFRPEQGERMEPLAYVEREPFIASIHQAQFKQVPTGYRKLSAEEIARHRTDPKAVRALVAQEPGTRPSCALPYELYVDGVMRPEGFELTFAARNETFGKKALGAPFQVYQHSENGVQIRSYTVAAGTSLKDYWREGYHLQVYGPNGFYREFRGGSQNPALEITCTYPRNRRAEFTGQVVVNIKNLDPENSQKIRIIDRAYGAQPQTYLLPKKSEKGAGKSIELDLSKSANWYDFSVTVEGVDAFEQRYAGRVETGRNGWSDPQLA